MEWAWVKWRMPRRGFVKVNVHGHFQDQPFANGNRSGIRVVIRNSRGIIRRLYVGSLRITESLNNELYAMLESLNRAYLDEFDFVELETDNVGAYMEWNNSSLGALPEHRYVFQQINQRKADLNLVLKVNPIDEDDNAMLVYLAQHGAANYDHMVVISNLFGRIFEIWCNDMGLGPVNDQFVGVHEEDVNAAAANDEVINQAVDIEEPRLSLE
ncbi:hypothetical protein POM88_023201 [Heracleum sosnowskyi]|uniref:RNase H type-1 domain-containing protein n=1 Tax=Heracleum sosnowskyi TaxID=360622 RepID=A0AAD8IIA7_9APIA|nr:hypothetical protein POM88_023201 [Heracleum sosnowskyi]